MKHTLLFLAGLCLFISCDMADKASLSGDATSGSITKFKIAGEVLYVIDGNALRVFSISDPALPIDRGTIDVGFGPETLFRLGDVLFVGAQTGMYMFSIEDPYAPDLLSHYEHVLSCDPVVANAEKAYVTLRSGSACRGHGIGIANELQTLDVTDKRNPRLQDTQPMQFPKGLGLDQDLLFVCDGKRGVLVYDLSSNGIPEEIATILGIEALDVIAQDGHLIVVTRNQLLQYDYSNLDDIKLISHIEHGV